MKIGTLHKEEARAAGSDFRVIGAESGDFGDAWMRFYRAPSKEQRAWLKDMAGDVIIRKPGQHPGGKAWWITPLNEVLVPVTEEIEQ